MEQLLREMQNSKTDQDSLTMLTQLVAALRPAKPEDHVTAVNNARALCYLLEQHSEYRDSLRNAFFSLLDNTRQVNLYTETGILLNESFMTAVKRRIGAKILPPTVNAEHFSDLLGVIFHKRSDYLWLEAIPHEVWYEIGQALHMDEVPSDKVPPHIRLQQLEAIQVLSCRISAIGLEPEVIRNHPDVERFESPFVRLNAEVLNYIEKYRHDLTARQTPDEDHSHLLVLLEQCEGIMAKVWKYASKNGASVSLTYHLLRLKQHIDRMKLLFELVDPTAPQGEPLIALFLSLVKAENRKNSVGDVFRENTELLALQITEHASHTGEHYTSESRREWLDMFRSAAGAGVIVGFMALIKIKLATAHLPLLLEAFAFSMNYALGFMLVHILHCTIATKQPAMTAASIAAALPAPGSKNLESYSKLIELIVKVIRTQFIAIMGNVLLAMPVALGIAWLWWDRLGEHVVSPEKADILLRDLQPIAGLGLPHAAIAGVCLFLAGLISGYYDNKALYNKIPERIAALPLLNKVIGEYRSKRLGQYIEHNLGALAGNFYFGCMLGSIGTIGILLGLPLDIRHITFSAANLSYAFAGNDFNLPLLALGWAAVGVALIGATNLITSFVLALSVALRSRKRRLRELKPVIGLLWKRFWQKPIDFIIAPKLQAEKSDE
ncbi:site-specific recombinase [Chitinibacter bivalviorum]|uniref:Site-specific recombinase n=1 Tax=Chitinibacter bivalviorum TaxID=2739434 RepID=A0A7H9BM29_9NEIS|nr:site-specific recombinase [Chitinibacter bivalviorum]QLG89687.1 site-specific recombinase [Chitinibacter bivalviorum]